MTTIGNTLPKRERLCGTKAISALMHSGRYGSSGCLKYCYHKNPSSTIGGNNRIMVSVPKKAFRRAVKRNLLKRRIRESYRLQKGLLTASGVDILFVYDSREILPFRDISSAVAGALEAVSAHEQ